MQTWKHPALVALMATTAILSMPLAGESKPEDSGQFSEVTLGPVPDPVDITLTPDKRHAVYVMTKDGKNLVLFDGQVVGPEFEGIFDRNSFVLSKDGTRMAYAVGREKKDGGCTTCGPQGKWWAVIDGKPGPEYDKVLGITFSTDGKHVAYGVTDKIERDFWRVVVDGKEIPNFFDAISSKSPAFTPDGNHVVCVARKDRKAVVIIDGKDEPLYDRIGHGIPFFSSDGKHMAYTAVNSGEPERVILDGKPGPDFAYIPVLSLLFSPDGQRFAYGGQEISQKWRVVTDGQPGPAYDQVDNIVFSKDGRHVAYKAKTGERWMLVIDGKPQLEFEELAEGFPVFSPDGRRLAHGYKENGKWKVRLDVLEGDGRSGIVGGKYNKGVGLITFSPDGERLAFGSRNGDKRSMIVDGQSGPEFDDITDIVFSPDGKRVAYVAAKLFKSDAAKKDAWFVVVDGQAQPEYDNLMRGSLVFSADSRHLAYAVSKGDTRQVVVDGQVGPEYKMVCNLFATAGNGFEAIVVGGNLSRLAWNP